MPKIQEVGIDGTVYRIREPLLRDYRESKKHPQEDLIMVFLAGMLLDEDDKPWGVDRVEDIPLSHFNILSEKVNNMITGGSNLPPLEKMTESASD